MKTITISKEFIINAPADEIFPLLCPVKEYDWIPGWKCKLKYCPKGKNEKGVIFTEIMTSPFLCGNATTRTTWTTMEYDTINDKVKFRWDNKISTSVFTIRVVPLSGKSSRCIFNLLCNGTNKKGMQKINSQNKHKVEFLLEGLGAMLKHYCETGTMLPTGKSDRKTDFLNMLTTREKLTFLNNKVHMKIKHDRDRNKYLTKGRISKKTTKRGFLDSLELDYTY